MTHSPRKNFAFFHSKLLLDNSASFTSSCRVKKEGKTNSRHLQAVGNQEQFQSRSFQTLLQCFVEITFGGFPKSVELPQMIGLSQFEDHASFDFPNTNVVSYTKISDKCTIIDSRWNGIRNFHFLLSTIIQYYSVGIERPS